MRDKLVLFARCTFIMLFTDVNAKGKWKYSLIGSKFVSYRVKEDELIMCLRSKEM